MDAKYKSISYRIMLVSAVVMLAASALAAAEQVDSGHETAIAGVGISILASTVMAFIGHLLKQPLLLAYLAAGIAIGPAMRLGLIRDAHDIETISHFGLILLLFLIGLEIDVKKLKEPGRSLIIGGLSQFPIEKRNNTLARMPMTAQRAVRNARAFSVMRPAAARNPRGVK